MIKNTHHSLDTETVKRIVQAVCLDGVKPSEFDVMVKNARCAMKGRAYTKGSAYHATARPFITAGLGHEANYPHTTIDGKDMGKGYLSFTLYTIVEGLVFILAHEIRHIWQGKYKGMKRVYGSKGIFSERDADAYAIHCVRRFRRGELLP